ncbi:MAG: AraC family transcriptional regulator [Leadbetterella sp.]
MNPILEKVTVSEKQSFALKEEILPQIKIGWHYHPEYELVLFTESTGKRFIGDHTARFEPGDLLLIGPNLPHYMRNDEDYYVKNSNLRIRAIVVHFSHNFAGNGFFEIPEISLIKKLLERSKRGLHIYGETRDIVSLEMEKLLTNQGYSRFQTLLNILHLISVSQNIEELSSLGYANSNTFEDSSRIDKVFEFILKNYTEDITLDEVAQNIHMSVSAFCKFFKKRTGKTYTQTLNEIRVGHACKLLMEESLSVAEICYQSGFSNLSYFHRNFKKITKFAPLNYRQRFLS